MTTMEDATNIRTETNNAGTPLTADEALAVYRAALSEWIVTRNRYRRWQATQAELKLAESVLDEMHARYVSALFPLGRAFGEIHPAK